MGHRKGDPRPDQQINAPPGEIARTVSVMYGMMKQPKCDMSDPVAVAERYDWFVSYCVEHDLKPTIAGMALAYGFDRIHLLRMKDGLIKSIPEESCNTLKRAWEMMTALMEEYMVNGHINPIPGIFLLKNNHGYKDQTETVVVKKDPYESGNPEEIARKYLAGVTPALDVPSQNAPVVETVVIDQTGKVE